MLYYISKPLKLYLLDFKIYENIMEVMEKFLAHHIISLQIDEFELKVPSKTIEVIVSS